ncbi:LytR/AlgR family response regulator transcription factor [Neolewinella agarilytica]|uniref:Two component transcriptional regulator, LytTR family n=1 Tax=Neolewinella agarilytica TaxID=478744 RepID=A0A1H9HHH4_9BACT|nr:LytTR family DNA-binding domain-containing protein [Neolewinella agarilytica]SEQ61676.1 two component transcriptional regulator, LytTR family [Neolewinella agarilytica]
MTALIIEDEAAAARRLRKLVRQIDSTIQIIGELDSVETSVDFLLNNDSPDLIFLDIHLADGSSFDIFHYVEVRCPVIFTTAYDEYALKAFQVNVIDYLLKPIKAPALEQALEKHRRLNVGAPEINYRKLVESMLPEGADKRFLLRVGSQLRVVKMNEVAYFNTEDKVTLLTTHSGKRYPIDYSLEQLNEMVPSAEFFRINRQFIIRLAAIAEMHAYSKSRVKLVLNPLCKLETIVSTERSPHFKRWLEGQ